MMKMKAGEIAVLFKRHKDRYMEIENKVESSRIKVEKHFDRLYLNEEWKDNATVKGILSGIMKENLYNIQYMHELFGRLFESVRRMQEAEILQLEECKRNKTELVERCLQRAQAVYEELKLVDSFSKIKIGGQNLKVIKLDMPKLEEEQGRALMTVYLEIGGRYKNSDNVIAETDAEENKKVRFEPLSSFETPEAMERLTETFIQAINEEKHDPLLLIPIFILDFLCIHPFNDGNGRMSRLLTLMLLYRSGYIVGKYISVEMIIEKTKETYYDMLQASSQFWREGKNNYLPFVKYYLEITLSAYKEFSARVEHLQNRSLSKPERIKLLFENTLKRLSKRDIHEKCPDISTSTIEVTLNALLKDEYIIKTGAGKNTAYIRNADYVK